MAFLMMGFLPEKMKYINSYSKAVNATHVVKWENGKVVKSEMS